MEPVRIATIGTSTISDSFLEALSRVEGAAYVGTCSRDAERAAAYTERHGGTTPFTGVAELAASDEVDAVYVASPNGMHVSQAVELARAGKHLLVEKPLCANRFEADRLFAAAELHGVVAMEAMRPVHDPAFAAMRAALPRLGRLRRATLRFGKYSSRYDEVLAGRQTNIFDARMASGALMDIGIYCVEPMVALFGSPDAVSAMSVLVGTDHPETVGGAIDGAGSALCRFDDEATGMAGLVCELAYSKVSSDFIPCQVEGELGTLSFDAMSIPSEATLTIRGTAVRGAAGKGKASVGDVEEPLAIEPCDNNMVFEIADFVSCVRGEDVETMWGTLDAASAVARWRDVTLAALDVCDEIRRQSGIAFPTDPALA